MPGEVFGIGHHAQSRKRSKERREQNEQAEGYFGQRVSSKAGDQPVSPARQTPETSHGRMLSPANGMGMKYTHLPHSCNPKLRAEIDRRELIAREELQEQLDKAKRNSPEQQKINQDLEDYIKKTNGNLG